jgi:hypothetical protein
MDPMKRVQNMRFSSLLLAVITPLGVAIGLHEAWRLAGGLVFLMALQILVLTLVAVSLVRRVRSESARASLEK